MSKARKQLAENQNWKNHISSITYRPFDNQFIYNSSELVEWPRKETMQHMSEENLMLITVRQVAEGVFFSRLYF